MVAKLPTVHWISCAYILLQPIAPCSTRWNLFNNLGILTFIQLKIDGMFSAYTKEGSRDAFISIFFIDVRKEFSFSSQCCITLHCICIAMYWNFVNLVWTNYNTMSWSKAVSIDIHTNIPFSLCSKRIEVEWSYEDLWNWEVNIWIQEHLWTVTVNRNTLVPLLL